MFMDSSLAPILMERDIEENGQESSQSFYTQSPNTNRQKVLAEIKETITKILRKNNFPEKTIEVFIN